MALSKWVDLTALRRAPGISYYFRYPLYHGEVRELREAGRLRGYFTSKPLYGRLTLEGKVDRSAGFDGRIAVVFIPSPARSARGARLLFTQLPAEQIIHANGKRNWPAIHAAAERAVRQTLRRAS